MSVYIKNKLMKGKLALMMCKGAGKRIAAPVCVYYLVLCVSLIWETEHNNFICKYQLVQIA